MEYKNQRMPQIGRDMLLQAQPPFATGVQIVPGIEIYSIDEWLRNWRYPYIHEGLSDIRDIGCGDMMDEPGRLVSLRIDQMLDRGQTFIVPFEPCLREGSRSFITIGFSDYRSGPENQPSYVIRSTTGSTTIQLHESQCLRIDNSMLLQIQETVVEEYGRFTMNYFQVYGTAMSGVAGISMHEFLPIACLSQIVATRY